MKVIENNEAHLMQNMLHHLVDIIVNEVNVVNILGSTVLLFTHALFIFCNIKNYVELYQGIITCISVSALAIYNISKAWPAIKNLIKMKRKK